METRKVISVLFEACMNGEMKDPETYRTMQKEIESSLKHLQAGDLQDDDLSCLQYASMKAGFYAGVYAMKSLVAG